MQTNKTKSLEKTKALVGMAIFTALVVVLQLLAGVIKIGPFAPSLVLIPIVIGAAVFGPSAGAWLGLVFGIVVLGASVTGADYGGYLMWGLKPVVTALICLGKGTAAGYLAALTFRLLTKKSEIVATVCSAIVCPLVNTGLFLLGAVVAFRPLLEEFAQANGFGGQPLIEYLILGMVGVNFLVELLINVVLSPIVVRILRLRKIM